ncbi:MAG: antiviral reverse transcriptase Drt3a [Tannerellaceae bacterium]
MLDQSFSIETINTVFMLSNRKGRMKKEFLSVEYLDAAREYRKLLHQLKTLRRTSKETRTSDDEEDIRELERDLKQQAAKQNELLNIHISNIADNINRQTFRFVLTPDLNKDIDKPNYLIGKTAEEFFAMQILCRNLKHSFDLQMTNRNDMLCQVKQILKEDRHDKYIIRTDIRHCFESIPHNLLFELVDGNTLLDYRNKSMLKGLICKEFERKNQRRLVSSNNTGIPRGCAVSSYLAELYLSKIDAEIKRNLLNIAYYSRYVDDIIIIIHPESALNKRLSIEECFRIVKVAFEQKGLMLASEKTKYINTQTHSTFDFELLGYKFSVSGNVSVSHSENKKVKIIKRIDAIFNEFDTVKITNYIKAKSFLFDALRILTANTSLHNNKKSIKIGAYYSNQILDDLVCLQKYDSYLKTKIMEIKIPAGVFSTEIERKKAEDILQDVLLRNARFEEGFNTRKRFCISQQRFQEIKKSWL